MKDAIRSAECVVFLGFAYYKQYMALLKPQRSRRTKQVYGTAYKMSDNDVSEVVDELYEFFPDVETMHQMASSVLRSNVKVENKLTCSELFDHYAKSLAG